MLILTFFASFQQRVSSPVILEGVVLEDATLKPVANAYVYAVKGEEEALTDKHGFFTIKTWQSLPVTLTVQHQSRIKKVAVSAPAKKLQIVLNQK